MPSAPSTVTFSVAEVFFRRLKAFIDFLETFRVSLASPAFSSVFLADATVLPLTTRLALTLHAPEQETVTPRPLEAIALIESLPVTFAAGPLPAGGAGAGRTGRGARAVDRLAVGDDVDRVDDRAVGADAAVDRVGLAVAGVDHVVAERDRAASSSRRCCRWRRR